MGFSLTAALGAASPLLSAVLPAGIGQVANILAAGFTAAPAPQSVPRPAQGRSPSVVPARAAMITALNRGSVVGEILAIASQNTGRRVTKRMIIEAAKFCGIATAASNFGLSEGEVCTIVISRRRRRSRGISAADVRRTRATLRKVGTLRKQLKAIK